MRCACASGLLGALLSALLCPSTSSAEDRPWAFVAVTDPEPHVAIGTALAPFVDDVRYLKETFFAASQPDRPAPEFIIVPGDIAPLDVTDRTFRQVLGPTIPWLPVPGNHDLSSHEAKAMADLLAGYEKLGLRTGPAGAAGLEYSFTAHDALFVGLDIYWDGKEKKNSAIAGGGLNAENLDWLSKTLAGSNARYKIVYGHRPAWPAGGRHDHDPLASDDLRDRFWKALADNGCQLYLCGHTHSYDAYRWLGNSDPHRWQHYNSKLIADPLGVWQIDAGSVRGSGSAYDRTVVYFRVSPQAIEVETRIWPHAAGRKGHYETPANTADMPYQFKIHPRLADNIPQTMPDQDAGG